MRRLKIGDVFQIETSKKGKGYFQYIPESVIVL